MKNKGRVIPSTGETNKKKPKKKLKNNSLS